VDWETYHLTTKSSPSGGQALVSSLSEAVVLPKKLIKSISTLGGKELVKKLDLIRQNPSLIGKLMSQSFNYESNLRRIHCFSDSEGKTRVIAIGDYWSQTCLVPLHNSLYKILSSIPQDRTYTQSLGIDLFNPLKDETYFCFDLSAFTDRFPCDVLHELLKVLIGISKANAWYDIMVGYPFKCDFSKDDLRYTVGNPMGFYSS